MNNLDNSIELLTLAAAKYASDSVIEEHSSTVVEALVDGLYDESIRMAMESGYTNILDAMCATVKDSHIIVHKKDIIKDVLTYSKWDLLVQVMSREPYRKAIQQVLNKMNDHADAFGYINSKSRFNTVYFDFVKWFATYSVCTYEQGTYTGYIKKAFENFYYKQYKKDIWAALREVDFAKKEVDMKHTLSSETLTVAEKGDVYVNQMLTNIYLANKLLFQHSGHTMNTIVYDIFHLILNYRLGKYVDALNEKLTTMSIEILDTGLPCDENNTPMLYMVPKGALSKISNAWDMIPKLYEYVASKSLNEVFIADLRKYTFSLGKSATSDSNCVWKLEDDTKETQAYLDRGKAITNYANFSVLINGIISAYTLMECIEARGISVVDIYHPDFFKDIDLIRSLDYFSSLQHKDLILKLQQEELPETSTELLDSFDQLVYRRAGSKENNRIENKQRREKAYTFGMLRDPALKQKKVKTPFDILQGIYHQMAAIPKSYSIYQSIIGTPNPDMITPREVPPDVLGSSMLYNTLDYNVFLQEKQILAKDYLSEYSNKVQNFIYYFPSIDEDFKETVLVFNGVEYPYREDISGFVVDGEVYAIEQIKMFIQSSGSSEVALLERPKKIVEPVELFPLYLGLHHTYSDRQLQVIERIYAKNKDTSFVCRQYHQTLFAISKVQEDFLGLVHKLREFLNFCIANGEYTPVKSFIGQFKRKEFNYELFSEVLFVMFNRYGIDTAKLSRDDLIHSNEYTLVEKLILGAYLKQNWKDFAYDAVIYSEAPAHIQNLFREFLSGITTDMNPVSVFVYLYNYLYLQILFHVRLRDSYEMLFLVQNMEIKSVICELTYGFHLLGWYESFVENMMFGCALDNIPSVEILTFLRTICKLLYAKYKFAMTAYSEYVNECANIYSSLYNYRTNHTPTSKQEFESYGIMFGKTQNKTGIPELDRLRETCVCDKYGFFLRNGEYLKSHHGNSEYYIHRTGNLLLISGDSYRPIRYSEYTKDSREAEFSTIISNCIVY